MKQVKNNDIDEPGKPMEPWQEPETTIVRGIASGGMGGEPSAVDSKNGKIVRIRPMRWNWKYDEEHLSTRLWKFTSRGKTLECPPKSSPPYFALAYKKRVYSDNRVKYPLKRVDWEPGGDPDKINPQNRGKSKFKRISWDEAASIIASEIRRVRETYGPYAVLAVGEDGHCESKNLHMVGGCHMSLLDKVGGYTRETRTPDSVEGFYWGAKHVWGTGANMGLAMTAPSENIIKDVADHTNMIVLQAGDWETVQNYAGQWWSHVIRFYLEIGIKFVVIDPFCNYTAVAHDEMKWVPILPNTDAALDFAIIYTWIKEDTYDKDYVETHTIGFDKVKAYVMGEEDGVPKTPEWASKICGVPEWTIKALAREWARKPTSIGHFCGAHIRGPYSHEAGRTEAYKLCMQGMGGPGVHQIHLFSFNVARQPAKTNYGPILPAMQATQFMPTEQAIPRTMVHHAIEKGEIEHYGSPQIIFAPAEDQFEKYVYPACPECGGGEVHMMWSEKPCNQGCWNGGFKFQEAMRSPKMECIITNHQWLENDSLFADLVLPVSCAPEENDAVGSGMCVSVNWAGIQDKACDPVGESKSDYQIAVEIAKQFGLEDEMTQGMTDEEWLEYAFSISTIADHITFEEFKEKGYYIPPFDPDWEEGPSGLREFYDDPENHPLDTPSGKIEFYSEALAENFPDDKERGPIAKWVIGGPESEGWTHDETQWGEKVKKYPLLLVANPGRWRVHVQGDDITWFREISTCKIKGDDGYMYEPMWIHPKDAEARGLKHGDIVKMYNDEGTILVAAYISERMLPGAIMVNKGARVDPITERIDRGGSTNLITTPKPISKNCWGFAVTGFLVEAEKLDPAEMAKWQQDYPEVFARTYDPASGSRYNGWVEGVE
ncbi:MAG: molybdopterin-dependent oxidoreductase [Chloroflexota bacterium]